MKSAARTVKSEPAVAAKAVEPPKPRIEGRPFVIQRKCGCGGSSGGTCECDEQKKIQRKARGAARIGDEVPAEVERALAGPGAPLAADVRDGMERRFGHDFGAVRIHVDRESARAVNARAYTVGSHIVFDGQADAREPRLLAHELTHVVQQRSGTFAAGRTISDPADAHEREADAVAERVTAGGAAGEVASAPARIARQAEEERQPAPETAAPEPAPRGSAGAAPAAPAAPSDGDAPPRIVDDDVDDVGAGQMRKSEFLDELSAAACEAADAELARVGRSTEGCPYVERALAYYRRRRAAQVERAIRLYAPGTARAGTAREYIPLVAARIGRGVAHWASTGEISGIPPELAAQMPAMGLPELLGAGLRAVGSAIGGAFSAIGRLFGKPGGGTPVPAFDAGAASAARNAGAPLDGGVRSRMERAFGSSFAAVRVHTGGEAAGAATRIGARAYTIGSDIAFARGEYQPGTLVGDALIAHELAHVVQQRGAVTWATGNDSAYEEDADTAAVGAMAAAWGGARGRLRDIAKNAGPRLRSGLRLSRCGGGARQTRPTPGPAAAQQTAPPPAGPCEGPPLAPTAEGTERYLNNPVTPGPDEFGTTSKLAAYPQFGARREGGQWHFCLTALDLPVKSGVQPEGFRREVSDANSSEVTATSWSAVVADLDPHTTGRFGARCGPRRWVDTLNTYSRRDVYWKRELVVAHERFHRIDWVDHYRRQLIPAEQQVRAHTIPEADAANAEQAVARARDTLQGFITPTYMATCEQYSPQQESRAYADGAPQYQALVDAIRARAAAQGWTRP